MAGILELGELVMDYVRYGKFTKGRYRHAVDSLPVVWFSFLSGSIQLTNDQCPGFKQANERLPKA